MRRRAKRQRQLEGEAERSWRAWRVAEIEEALWWEERRRLWRAQALDTLLVAVAYAVLAALFFVLVRDVLA